MQENIALHRVYELLNIFIIEQYSLPSDHTEHIFFQWQGTNCLFCGSTLERIVFEHILLVQY